MAGTTLGSGDVALNNREKISFSMWLIFSRVERVR